MVILIKKNAQESVIKWRSMNLIPFVFFFTSTCWEKKIKPTFIGRYWYIIITGWCKFLNMNWSVLILKKVIRLIFYNQISTGHYYPDKGEDPLIPELPLETFNVKPDKYYRFRIINAAMLFSFRFSIDEVFIICINFLHLPKG